MFEERKNKRETCCMNKPVWKFVLGYFVVFIISYLHQFQDNSVITNHVHDAEMYNKTGIQLQYQSENFVRELTHNQTSKENITFFMQDIWLVSNYSSSGSFFFVLFQWVHCHHRNISHIFFQLIVLRIRSRKKNYPTYKYIISSFFNRR